MHMVVRPPRLRDGPGTHRLEADRLASRQHRTRAWFTAARNSSLCSISGSEAMLKMARELARHGRRLPMIEALLVANGFQEADVFLNQLHIHNELVDIADRVRRGEQAIKGTESLAAP